MSKSKRPVRQKDKVDRQHRSAATKAFLGLLTGLGILYGVVLAYHMITPLPSAQATEASWLEQCRQLCAHYGLVYTGDIKEDANAYLDAVESKELSSSLEHLLSDPEFLRADSEQHPLIGRQAPEFRLLNTNNEPVSSTSLTQKGPLVLVFYYGYNCSHCVAQLFALQKDLEYFHELGAEVVAISADAPEHTREKYGEYGGFAFPVLSDPDYSVSEAWGIYVRPSPTQQEDLLHGTFVIDRSGIVIFANRGYQPFVDNQSLLQWISPPTTHSDQLPNTLVESGLK